MNAAVCFGFSALHWTSSIREHTEKAVIGRLSYVQAPYRFVIYEIAFHP
jgi:hypothetical protein